MLALSLCFVPGTDAKATAKKPSITKSVTIFRNSGTRVIVVNNMKKTDKIIKVIPKNNDYNAIGAWTGERRDEIVISALNVTKTGDTKVYVNVRRGKTVYKLTMKGDMLPPLKSLILKWGFLLNGSTEPSIYKLSSRAPRFFCPDTGIFSYFSIVRIRTVYAINILLASSRMLIAALRSLSISFPHAQR